MLSIPCFHPYCVQSITRARTRARQNSGVILIVAGILNPQQGRALIRCAKFFTWTLAMHPRFTQVFSLP